MSDTGYGSQPKPIPNDLPSAHDLVAADLAARKEFGFNKYGALLQPDNGRDSLQDAYEECLDLCVYLRNAIEERNIAAIEASKPIVVPPTKSRILRWLFTDE